MSRQMQIPVKTYVVGGILAGIVGLAAIYVMSDAGDNARQPKSNGTQAATTDKPAASARTGERLNVGDMATFVFKDKPAPVPEFSFQDADGQTKTLADWRGKVVLLNIWATWCGPCRKEMPSLDQLKTDLGGEDFDVVAISIDRGSATKPKAFIEEIGTNALKFYHDPTAQLGFTLNAIGMPATLLIDREGREIGRLVGPAEWHSDDAKKLIKAHMSGGE